MKSFREFLNEATEAGNKIVQFKRKLAGATDPAEKARLQKAIADAMKASQNKAAGLGNQKFTAPNVPPKAGSGTRSGGSNQVIPGQPNSTTKPGTNVPPRSRLTNFGKGSAKFGAVTAADIGSEYLINKIKDPGQQAIARTVKDLAVTFAAPVVSALGSEGSTPQRQEYQTDKTTQIVVPPNYGTKSYEKDPNSPKNKIYVQKTKPRISDDQMYDPKNPLDVRKWKFQMGSPQPVGKPEPYGVAVQGGTTSLAPYGSVAGIKKVGGKNLPQVTQARQQSSKANVYGATKGSALTGIGGPTKVDTKAGTLTSKGKTVKLASTQLVKDPKTGQQRVGDLAYKGGKAVYLARGSVADRNSSLLSRLSRSTGIGGQRERDAAASKREYGTALKSTQAYTKGLGISAKSATAQKLPGYGTAPAPKPAPKNK